MAPIQEGLDRRLSRNAQFVYAEHFRKSIAKQDQKFRFPAGMNDLHWKDACKLELYRLLYRTSVADLAELSGMKPSTLHDVLNWCKYKSEGFHRKWIKCFDFETRHNLAKEYNIRENWIFTIIVDGTHVPFDAAHINWCDRDGRELQRFDFRSGKKKTLGRCCVNVVIFSLANGYVSTILFPCPAKDWSDSVVIHRGFNPHDEKSNQEIINENYCREDAILGDCGFRIFCCGSRIIKQRDYLLLMGSSGCLERIYIYLYINEIPGKQINKDKQSSMWAAEEEISKLPKETLICTPIGNVRIPPTHLCRLINL